jgi:small GTP-binding protein
MIQKKICMLGASAVGKTSLVSRFVRSIFSEKYHTTVGVKVDKKVVALGEDQMDLLLWDLYGEDEFQKMRTSYLRGSSGYMLVVDGTRHETLEKAVVLQNRTEETLGKVPFVLVLNKTDLVDKWEVDDSAIEELGKRGWTAFRTSAKTGEGVEQAFLALARKMAGSMTA